jgi:hypothetical protein
MSKTTAIGISAISDLDWAQMPSSVKHSLMGRIEQLEQQCKDLKAENAML